MGGEVSYVASHISYSSAAVNHLPPQITELFCLMVLSHAGKDVTELPSSHADG